MAARISPAKGKKGDKLIRDALMLELKQHAQDANGKPTRKIRLLAEALMAKALEGDVAAIKEVADRVDGRPKQETEHSGTIANPLAVLYDSVAGITASKAERDSDSDPDSVH